MTITVDVFQNEFSQLKGNDKATPIIPPRNFIILKQNDQNNVGDTVIVQEKNELGEHTGQELHFEINYIIGDHIGMKKDYRCIGLKPKEA